MALFLKSSIVFFYNINKLTYLLTGYPVEPVPEETFTHLHPREEEGFAQTARSTVWIHCA